MKMQKKNKIKGTRKEHFSLLTHFTNLVTTNGDN